MSNDSIVPNAAGAALLVEVRFSETFQPEINRNKPGCWAKMRKLMLCFQPLGHLQDTCSHFSNLQALPCLAVCAAMGFLNDGSTHPCLRLEGSPRGVYKATSSDKTQRDLLWWWPFLALQGKNLLMRGRCQAADCFAWSAGHLFLMALYHHLYLLWKHNADTMKSPSCLVHLTEQLLNASWQREAAVGSPVLGHSQFLCGMCHIP